AAAGRGRAGAAGGRRAARHRARQRRRAASPGVRTGGRAVARSLARRPRRGARAGAARRRPMRTLVVDDEPLARKELRRLLAAHAWIEIVGEAATAAEAEARIAALRPGLLLLDIEMPGGTGFDLLARLDQAPRVIFTTAYDQHAVRAFEVNALDSLLKPIDPRRLAAALARVDRAADGGLTPAAAPLDRLFVRDGDRCWFVVMREVR